MQKKVKMKQPNCDKHIACNCGYETMTHSKSRQEIEWPKDLKDRFYAKFVFSDGYIGEQKPSKILRFIRKEIKEVLKKMLKDMNRKGWCDWCDFEATKDYLDSLLKKYK